MQVWIGTSGYSYADWVGGFYPAGMKSTRMLAYYCQHFPLVELNFTFYRLPTAAMLQRLVAQTPSGFQFLVKLPRSLSHEESTAELDAFRQALEPMRRESRLQGLLCQLPQATHHLPKHRAWLDRLAAEFAGHGLAVEFRHRSWWHSEVPVWLAERKVDLVSVDAPNLPNLYPSGLVQSSSRIYVRFHSRNAVNWYRSDKDRYDYDYSDNELSEWIEAIGRSADGSDKVLLLFNNCQRSQAAANAKRMRELLDRLGPGVELIEPLATPQPGPQQRLLFE